MTQTETITHKHLTAEQKATLISLFDECNMEELLLTVAGIVRHRVHSNEHSEKARKAIMEARSEARKGMLGFYITPPV
jgi:hypothetical protein